MSVDTFKKVRWVLNVILVANIAVALLKIIIGNIIKSTSMTADGFHSLTDGSSNIVALIGIKFASKPVDEDHPYGHSKFETLAGLFIAGMLCLIGGKIVIDAFSRFINPVMPEVSIESLIALIVTLGVNIFVCMYEYRQGKILHSQILISDSKHTKSDIYVSIGVLVTLIGIRAGLPPIIDPIASLVVSIFIIQAAYEIFKSTSDVLVDKAAIETDTVEEIARSFSQVKDVHKIRSRGNEQEIHIDMHILTDPDMSIEESHRLIHEMEEKMKQELHKNVQFIVHLEPFYEKMVHE